MLPQPIFSSTFVCIITIFSILLLLPPSYSDPLDEFTKCNLSASFQCGNHGTFYYPFWNDNTPEHCRPLGFHLKDCEKAVPTIDFGLNGSFQLYCTPPYEVPPGTKIDCGPDENNKPFFFMHGMGEPETEDSYGCSTVKVAVNQTVFNKVWDGKLTLVDALRQFWFDVEYNSNAVFCHQCESLGGTCEFNSSSDQCLQTTCQHLPEGKKKSTKSFLGHGLLEGAYALSARLGSRNGFLETTHALGSLARVAQGNLCRE
ncbi:hypothetical protein SLEP1_g47238 [Rubroshorea leprosula]|uniref:Wall-associated receptor kinase C-terminal domain-containing protein n=1 Tax=Rubroshorea leprosula TaxID=152421 RepID=A0AAV5LQR2_9ROSI|nr:hypothetical protein SLEP1_g47238 [Rubroshorea leprosula]